MDMQQNVLGVQHLGLPTRDFQGTLAFYRKLGFSVVEGAVSEDRRNNVAFLKLKDTVIETWQCDDAVMAYGAIDHIALNVRDIREAYRWAKEEGMTILDAEIRTLPFYTHGVSFFTIEGPNKEKIEYNMYL